MTKEDLKTEAESCWSRWSKDEPISIQDIHLMVVASYIEAAESRENRIAELEATLTEQKQYTAFKCAQAKEKIEALEKEKCELLGIIQGKDNVIKDLEWQLQEVAKDNDNYQAENKELEKENAELKEQNANLIAMLKAEREVRVNDDYLKGICEKDAEIGELEGKVENWTSEYYELENFMNNKVAKAKEIIKKFSEFVNNEAEYDPEHPQEHTDLWNELCEQAERFLSEVKE